VIGWHQSL
jgi:hypothetical protein